MGKINFTTEALLMNALSLAEVSALNLLDKKRREDTHMIKTRIALSLVSGSPHEQHPIRPRGLFVGVAYLTEYDVPKSFSLEYKIPHKSGDRLDRLGLTELLESFEEKVLELKKILDIPH